MSRRLGILLVPLCASLIGLVVGVEWLNAKPSKQDLVVSTATRGGTYIRLGELLARALEESASKEIGQATAVESAGSLENIDRLTDP